jgi:antibiotic biosynthesis monooxygenase (ABM) superfamily enzyme
MKMKLIASLKIWILIYPLLTLFLYFFQETLSGIPIYLRTLLITLILVPFLVFIGLPSLNRLLERINHKDNNSSKDV